MEIKKSIYPPIFLSSADSYSDIWELFFSLFKKHWPEYDGTIYLNTQTKEIKVDGLNIICTKLGHLGSFGKEMRAGLDMINSDTVILMLIDFIIMGKVDNLRIIRYLEFFKKNDLDTLNFMYYDSVYQDNSYDEDVVFVNPPAPNVFFNYQVAFWKKSVLYQMVLPHENPWTSEWFGTRRAERIRIKKGLVLKSPGSPINYHPSGCLTKGKWHTSAVEFIQKSGMDVDFTIRGISKIKNTMTLTERISVKKMIIKDGIKGSYLDLFKRKWFNK